jgi:hypothetical protein
MRASYSEPELLGFNLQRVAPWFPLGPIGAAVTLAGAAALAVPFARLAHIASTPSAVARVIDVLPP